MMSLSFCVIVHYFGLVV